MTQTPTSLMDLLMLILYTIYKVRHLNFQPRILVIADKVWVKLYNKYIIKEKGNGIIWNNHENANTIL